MTKKSKISGPGLKTMALGSRDPARYLNVAAKKIFAGIIEEAKIDLVEVREWVDAYEAVPAGRCLGCNKTLKPEANYCPQCGKRAY